jgi:hypothetical protein
MVLLHEATHISIGFLMGLKIKTIKIFRMKGDMPLWNGVVNFEYSKYNFRWLAALYAPLLLLIPVLLMFLHPILFYIGLYIISTIIIYKGKVYWLVLPSIPDIQYKKRIEYYSYLIDNVGLDKFSHYFKVGRLNSLIEFRKLLNEKSYFEIKSSNKIKNNIYKVINKLKINKK